VNKISDKCQRAAQRYGFPKVSWAGLGWAETSRSSGLMKMTEAAS
jgi:hypothetical protein